MSSVPPNDINKVVPWLRVNYNKTSVAQGVLRSQFKELEKTHEELKNSLEELKASHEELALKFKTLSGGK